MFRFDNWYIYDQRIIDVDKTRDKDCVTVTVTVLDFVFYAVLLVC